MRTSPSVFRRWLLLPTILVCIHSGLVALLAVSVATSSDSEAMMAWFLPYYIDYPASLLVRVFEMTSDWQMPIFFFILGVVYWGTIGILLQSVWRWFVRRYEKIAV
jgi:hypothetical protein